MAIDEFVRDLESRRNYNDSLPPKTSKVISKDEAKLIPEVVYYNEEQVTATPMLQTMDNIQTCCPICTEDFILG